MNTKVLLGILISILVVGSSVYFFNTTPNEIEIIRINATIETNPTTPQAGKSTTITLQLRNQNGDSFTNLHTYFTRLVHIAVVSSDFRTIGYLHPEDFAILTKKIKDSGDYMVEFVFPEAGIYTVIATVSTEGGPFTKKFEIVVEGEPVMKKSFPSDVALEKCFTGLQEEGSDRYIHPIVIRDSEADCKTGYNVSLTHEPKEITVGEPIQFSYTVEYENEPVTDLNPILNATADVYVISESFNEIAFHHGLKTNEPKEGTSEKTQKEVLNQEEQEILDELKQELQELEDLEKELQFPTLFISRAFAHDDPEAHNVVIPEKFGPIITIEPITFSQPGKYHVFGRIKHNTSIIITHFIISVK
jgi:hypothetical protein